MWRFTCLFQEADDHRHRGSDGENKKSKWEESPRRPRVKEEPPDREDRPPRHRGGSVDRHRSGHGDRRRPPRERRRSRSDSIERARRQNDHRRREAHRQRSGAGQEEPWGRAPAEGETQAPPAEKAKPDFKLSGKLTEDTNMYKGVVIKYNEPPEARKPKKMWRLYPFKGDVGLPIMHLHRQSAYLLGRERRVADIPIDHPSCSKQHAVLQFRLVPYEREDGTKGRRVCPYIIDLNSANGTFVNNQRIEAQRYVQLFEKDVVKFGFSSREYVLLHGGSDTAEVVGDDEGQDWGIVCWGVQIRLCPPQMHLGLWLWISVQIISVHELSECSNADLWDSETDGVLLALTSKGCSLYSVKHIFYVDDVLYVHNKIILCNMM